jgi:adenylyl-sulfate kinase
VGHCTRHDRERLLGQRGMVVWFTGLSGSGKSTIASGVEAALVAAGRLAYVVDGDNLRHGLNADLGFSDQDRRENIRRAGEVAGLLADAGVIVLVCLISPFRSERDQVRQKQPAGRFLEVFVDAPLGVCEARDPKGLYRRARAGQIPEFTGITSPYEPPLSPELALDAAHLPLEQCVARTMALIAEAR